MRAAAAERVLFSQTEIHARVENLAHTIAALPERPAVAAPVLTGAFVFAADLLRALARHGLDLATDFLWLRAYGGAQVPGDVSVLRAPSDAVRGRHVLLIDGVLDSGATLACAKLLLTEAGAAKITTIVAVTKKHGTRALEAEYTAFRAGEDFLYGYGMDRDGVGRGLPDIRVR